MNDYVCNACGMKCGGTCYQPAKETSATRELKDKKIKQLEARVKELEEELSEAIEIIEFSGVDYDEVLEAIKAGE